MVDLIFTSVKKLSSSIWSNMADLADKIDDLICSFEGGGDTTMDTLAMIIFGWTVLGLITVAIVKYVYARFFAKAPVAAPEPKKATPVTAANADAVHTKPKEPSSPEASDGEKSIARAEAVLATKAPGRGGKYVPPTPPLRKRLSTKKGSGPTPAGPRTHALVSPPTVTGPDFESVRWVNEVFLWLYSDLSVVNEMLNVWIQSLNDYSKNSVAEHGVGVEIVRILPETHAPNISNVFCECASNDDITITCDCEATPALQLKAFRQRGEKVEVSHYRLNVNRFRARLNISCVTEKLLADVKCDGWPDIKVALAQVGSLKNNLDEQSLQDVISEIIVTAMRNAVVHLNLSNYPSCPRFSRYVPPPQQKLPVHYDSLAHEMMVRPEGSVAPAESNLPAKRLLVKVVQAKDLRGREPYCVVEMDDPPQKNQTSVKKDTNSPEWNEHFLLDLGSNTGEILFEIYDKPDKKFLGLGIVGVEELLINPNQRQTISLQPRPYENEDVTGTLTVEFMFVEGSELPNAGNKPFKLKETLRYVAPSGNVITTSKTVFTAEGDHIANGGEAVTDSALKELELRNKANASQSQASKSTLIIHSVRRHDSERGVRGSVKVRKTPPGTWHEVPIASKQGTLDTPGSTDVPSDANSAPEDEGRSRSRRRRRDFFGTIKRRFARSRTRSKSVDPGERVAGEGETLTRSVSADRMRDPSAHSTVPSLRVTDGELSRRSSVSDLSGLSGTSGRTYINEASTLVLETLENGIKKHYLIPLSLAQKSKWRKKGTKLHIFNDHTFIAKHLSGSTTCEVCATLIPRRWGKTGYECRDCLLKCHKACHVKVDQTCPQSTIQSIELSLLPVLSE
ncbi:UNVERIFIED_CONTAM: hypothetical protein PYX00_006835 [Menopon gallinae]|uniref:C2 domain-containing protein n=1 Tax=Menopon gallinae TaxID=328185 RepID=A0AAW2HYD6_9NEOP